MTVGDSIKDMFIKDFGVRLSHLALRQILKYGELNEDDDDESVDIEKIQIAVCRYIPTLLLHPASIGESGFSISRAQRADIESYYSIQCQELGIPNQLKPKVSFVRR